jgi:hypothetical protein
VFCTEHLWHFRSIVSKVLVFYFSQVSKWNINSVSVAILVSMMVLFVLILVLPQVDLLDTAFHRDSAPTAIKARSISAPVFAVVNAALPVSPVGSSFAGSSNKLLLPASDSTKVASLLCIFRC